MVPETLEIKIGKKKLRLEKLNLKNEVKKMKEDV